MFTGYCELSEEFTSLFKRASNNSILQCNAHFTSGVEVVLRDALNVLGSNKTFPGTPGRNHAPLGIRIQSSMTAVCVVIISLAHFIPTQTIKFLFGLSSICYLLYSLSWVGLLPRYCTVHPATNDSDALLSIKTLKSTTTVTVAATA